jgi:hypothetical protein
MAGRREVSAIKDEVGQQERVERVAVPLGWLCDLKRFRHLAIITVRWGRAT